MSARATGMMLAAATLIVVALSTGASIYYLMFGMIAAMLVISALSAFLTLISIRVTSQTPKTQVTRGDSAAVRLRVARRTLLPVYEISVIIASPSDEMPTGNLSVTLGPMQGREYRYTITCPHRGRYSVGPERVEVSDVFGLFRFSRRISGGSSVLDVLPRVYTLPPMVLSPGDTGPQMRIQMSDDAASPSDVRAWRDGDVLKKVHWKLTARRRELMVKTFEDSARPDTLVLMDVAPVSAIRSHALAIEDALCETALSTVLAQLKADHPVRMPVASAQPTELSGINPADFPRFMEAVKDLTFDGQYPFEQVVSLEMRRMQRTGGVIIITSKLTATLADLALRMRRFGMQVMFMWITDSSSDESLELKTRMELGGVKTQMINTWSSLSGSERATA